MAPQLLEIPFKVLIELGSCEFLLLSEDFLSDRETVSLVDPVLRQLPLCFLAACAIASAVRSALFGRLALSLQVETAFAVAAAVGVILTNHWIRFEHDSMSIEDQSVHQFIILFSEVADINIWLWHDVVLHARVSCACVREGLHQ